MKILKIENNQGYFTIDGTNYESVDKIEKELLLQLLDVIINNDCEMDQYNDESIKNPVHKIIYSSLYSKLQELKEQMKIFKEECEKIYKDAIDKYSKP